MPVLIARIAGSNGPHLDPITDISFTMVGVRSMLRFDAIVDFSTTIP